MYTNYGDRNFFEQGLLVDTEHSDTGFDMLFCEPYSDAEDLYQFGHIYVNIGDGWIDRDQVMSYIGMDEADFDPVQYAIGCFRYYGPENFGAGSYGVSYDWTRCTSALILDELKDYLIAWDDLVAEPLD